MSLVTKKQVKPYHKDIILKDVKYKNQDCIVVYYGPEFDADGSRQFPEPMVYLSTPFDRFVAISDKELVGL